MDNPSKGKERTRRCRMKNGYDKDLDAARKRRAQFFPFFRMPSKLSLHVSQRRVGAIPSMLEKDD